jgi:hypothetical protein
MAVSKKANFGSEPILVNGKIVQVRISALACASLLLHTIVNEPKNSARDYQKVRPTTITNKTEGPANYKQCKCCSAQD